jgi:hypothetical protein
VSQNFANWAWMLEIFPLWAVMAGIWFGVASGPKMLVGPGLQKLIDGTAVLMSMCSSMGILIGLNCNSYISLPFVDPACHVSTAQLFDWAGL